MDVYLSCALNLGIYKRFSAYVLESVGKPLGKVYKDSVEGDNDVDVIDDNGSDKEYKEQRKEQVHTQVDTRHTAASGQPVSYVLQ